MQEKTEIPAEMQNKIYKKFCKLPLRSKLVVYARFVHGNSFRPQNNDMFGLNRRLVSNIFKAFTDSLKDEFNVSKKTRNKGKPKTKKSSESKRNRG